MDNVHRVRWDLAVMILSIVNGITIPVDIAFTAPFVQNTGFMIANYIIDTLFIVDLYLNFRTSYICKQTGEEVLDKKRIAKHYVTSF